MNQNLPAFVVMTASWSSKAAAQAIYNRLWGSGYLPTKHQGVALRSTGDPVLFLSNPPGVDAATRKRTLDAIVRLNQQRVRADRRPRDAYPDRPVRDGVPDANVGARADGHHERAEERSRPVWAGRADARHVMLGAACWPAAWPSATCGSCRSFTAAGTSTATWPATCRCNARTWTRRPTRW